MSKTIALAALLMIPLALTACETAPETPSEKRELEAEAQRTVERFKSFDAGLHDRFFQTAAGYAVFPKITKGGVGIGGAHGRGVVFENGAVVGYADLSQATIGAQLGGQSYSEIIFFQTRAALDRFKTGDFELAAQATGVVAERNAAAAVDYENGVAIFVVAGKGLMGEASVGGQDFDYVPKY